MMTKMTMSARAGMLVKGLLIHCQAGKGRTGIFMTLYDKMKNPEVPMMDIVVRQTKLGGSYPLYTEDSDNYKVPYYAEKARMVPLFCQYVEENYRSDYEVSWSEWLEAYGETEMSEGSEELQLAA